MSASEFDLGEGAAQVAPDLLKLIREKLEEAIKLGQTIEQMEGDLSAAKQNLHNLRTLQLPDLMARASMSSTTLGDHVLEVSEIVSGSLPKDPTKRAEAIKYLRTLRADDMIKTEVAMVFGKSQYANAEQLFNELKAQGHTITMDSTIHAQTLCAWARDRIKKGEPIDPDKLGLFVGKVAKIDLSKAAKKRAKEQGQ